MSKVTTILMLSAVLMFVAAPAAADWDPGDGHKMHYPQLPDPDGWDAAWYTLHLSDDWMCARTGPVSDIHLWVSYKEWNNQLPHHIPDIGVGICENIPAEESSTGYARPGDVLWSRGFTSAEYTVRHGGSGNQGWIDTTPWHPGWTEDDHTEYFQFNITGIEDPFIQEVGTIYWLRIHQNDAPQYPYYIGWKTTSSDHFGGNAVSHYRGTVHHDPNIMEILDPTGEGLDLAFVITPEPATLSLLALGGIGMLMRRRRK